MRMTIAAILLLAMLPSMSIAQNESVTVHIADPVGIWKVSMPRGFNFSLFSKTKWQANTDAFCEIEKISGQLTVHCLGFRLGGKDVSRGSVGVKGNAVRMTWGSDFLFAGINGTFRSADAFEGDFFVQAMGVSDDAPEKSMGTRMFLSDDAADKGGKSELLARTLGQMADAAFAPPDAARAPSIRILKPETLHELGAIGSILYLGETRLTPETEVSVYDVEFANGHLICALQQGAELEQFDCG